MVFLDMATSGNPAAKDFEIMLTDIEELINGITTPGPFRFEETEALWNAGIGNLGMMDDQALFNFTWDDVPGLPGGTDNVTFN